MVEFLIIAYDSYKPTYLCTVRRQGGDTEYPLAGLPISRVLGGYSL